MKKFLKALGVAALAAAVVPCKVEKDEETGVKTYQSLLSKLRVGPGEGGEGTDIRLDLLGGVVPNALGKSEEEDYADDELDLDTADTEPMFEMSLKVERGVPTDEEACADADEAQAIADEAQAAADEAQAIADEAQAAADEAQAIADEAQAVADKHEVDL